MKLGRREFIDMATHRGFNMARTPRDWKLGKRDGPHEVK